MKIIALSFVSALPSLLNVGGLLLITIYVYAVVGVSLFAEVKINGPMHELLNF